MENSKEKFIKSILASATIVLLYILATKGIVKLLWNSPNAYVLEGRIKFLGLMLIIVTAILIIIPYHIFGYEAVTGLYYAIIAFHALYIFVGIVSYIFSND